VALEKQKDKGREVTLKNKLFNGAKFIKINIKKLLDNFSKMAQIL